MKNKVRKISKVLIISIAILLLSLLIYSRLPDKVVLAATDAADATTESINRAIESARDWVLKVSEEGKDVIIRTSAPSIKDLVPSEQIMDDGTVYVTVNDLFNIPSILCSAKGTHLPGYGSTIVRSGGDSTDETDQGKKTAYLTVDDLKTATVFRKINGWSDYTDSRVPDYKYEPTTSRTYGRFTIAEERKATPAEAWVLAEMDKNLPGTGTGYTIETTDREYTGEEGAIVDTMTIDDKIIYIIGDPGNEEYLEKRDDNKYYYVNLNTGAEGGDARYSYVQFAWWKVKTVGLPPKNPIKDLDAGLAAEAEAFEDYIIEVTGNKDVNNLERNPDDTFKIDYKVSMKPDNAEDIHVQFNSETNKYLVGPFSVSYLRACTQQQSRPKVSFAGIASSILVGVDVDGNEVLDEDGNSLLQLGQNYRFVYNDPAAHEAKQRGYGDTYEDYPFPYSDEEFFIEIDYLEKVAGLKNFKLDFQYMTANGSFELLDGEYLQIHWEPMADVDSKMVTLPATGDLDDGTKVAMSNRGDGTEKKPDEIIMGDDCGEKIYPQGELNIVVRRYGKPKIDAETGNILYTVEMKSSLLEGTPKITVKDVSWNKNNGETNHVAAGDISGNKFTISMPPNSSIGDAEDDLEFKVVYSQMDSFGKASPDQAVICTTILKYKNADAGIGATLPEPLPETESETDTGLFLTGTYEKVGDFNKVQGGLLKGDENYWVNFERLSEPLKNSETGKITYQGVVKYNETPDRESIKVNKITWTLGEGGTGRTGTVNVESNNTFYIVMDVDKSKPRISETLHLECEYTYNAYAVYKEFNQIHRQYLGQRKGEYSKRTPLTYYNSILRNDGKVKVTSPKAGRIEITEDNKIYCKGAICSEPDSSNKVILDLDAFADGYENLEEEYIEYKGFGGNIGGGPLGYYKSQIGQFYISAPENNTGEISVKDPEGNVIEKITFDSVEVPPLCATYQGQEKAVQIDSMQATTDVKSDVTFYNYFVEYDNALSGNDGINPDFGNEDDKSYPVNVSYRDDGAGITYQRSGVKIYVGDDGTTEGMVKAVVTDCLDNYIYLNIFYKKDEVGGPPSKPSDNSRYKFIFRYRQYMVADEATSATAQTLVNAKGWHEVIDITAENGLGSTVSGKPVELEFLSKTIDLRTSISGKVWIDQDEQKDLSTGTLGIYDKNEKPADENSVEVIVWKVTYAKDGDTLKEVERELATGWDDGNKVIDFRNNKIFIDKNGEYRIPRINVPATEGLDGAKYVVSYDVEFIYDGQTYEATEYLKSTNKNTVSEKLAEFQKTADETAGPEMDYRAYDRDSYIVENADERKDFDSYFTEVYGRDPIDTANNMTVGEATGGDGGRHYFGPEESRVDGDYAIDLEYKSDVVSSATGYEKTQSELITKNSDGFVLDKYRFSARTSEAGLLLPYERQYHVEEQHYDNLMFQKTAYKPIDEYFHQINLGLLKRYDTDVSLVKDLYSSKVIVNEQETNYTFNSLAGLTDDILTQQIDASYREKNYKIDLYNSDYYYRSSTYNTIQDEITRKVLTAVKDKTDLRMFVTYRIAMYNESEVTDVSINEFKDYYDKSFTLVEDEIKANVLDNNGNREEKVVAVAPYFRKLSATGDTSDLYRYNKQEDLMATKVDNKVSNPAEKAVGELSFTTGLDIGTDEYFGSSSSSLRAVNADGTVNHDMMLEPGEAFEVFVTYEVDKQGFDAIQAADDADRSLLGQKNNIAEITNYSTAYTDESVARHKTTSYVPGQISGRVERDSAPDNINMKALDSVKYFEDDTEYAPVLNVNLRFADDRTLDGVVWEDSRNDGENADGIYDPSTESGIGNIDVTMVEKIRVNPGDLAGSVADSSGNAIDLSLLDYEFEYVWPDGAFGPDVEFTSRTKTSDSDETRGHYEFKNFVSGNYVVRFEYGNSYETLKYNGQDYKNTAYQTGMTNAETEYAEDGSIVTGTGDLPGKATLNNEWHDLSSNNNAKTLEETRVSDARDYEPRRMKVMAYSRTITNQNAEVLAAYINDQEQEKLTDEYKAILEANKDKLIENTAMVANTAKFNIEVEKQDGIAYKTVETAEGGENDSPVHEYRISNVDFGLVRRPETRLDVKKEISQITLTKNDGQDVVLSVKCDEDGNIIKDDNEANGLQKITEINKEVLAAGSQGFKYIAMESSFLNGLDVYITYKITVTNNSETDYVGERLASIKNVQELYDLVSYYETKADSTGEHEGLVPFNTGKGIVYGRYVGLNYYTNEVSEGEGKTVDKYGFDYAKDVKVTTTVDQMVDYVDNDISISKSETENVENQSWVDSTDVDRFNKFSSVSYLDNVKDDKNFVDKKARSYIGDSKNNVVLTENENIKLGDVTYVKTKLNDEDKLPKTEVVEVGGNKMLIPQVETITLKDVYSGKDALMSSDVSSYNPKLTKELLPGESATVGVVTSAHASEEAVDDMNYDNLAEVVMYSNTVGRRDMQTIPGNANMIAKQTDAFKAGANWSGDEVVVELADGQRVTTERDAYAARDTVTFSEPTGLSIERESINKVIRIILVSLIIAAIAVIIATITIVVKKTKYDDKDLLN